MARCVSRAMIDAQDLGSDLHGVALIEPACGRELRHRLEAEHTRLLREQVDPELVVGMGTFDRQVEALGQCLRSPGVIDVRVGEQDFGEVHTPIGDNCENLLEVTTRIDDGARMGFSRPDDRAVLLKSGDRDDGCAEGHAVIMLGYTPTGQRAICVRETSKS